MPRSAARSPKALQQTLDGKGRAVVFCHLSHSYPEGACLYFTAIFPRSDQPLLAMARDQAGGDRGDPRQWRHRSATITASAPTMPTGWRVDKGELGFKLLGAVAATLDPSGVMATGARR